MPSSFTSRSGATLARTPSHRQQAGRRRLAVLCAILGLAIASGVIGSLVRPQPGPIPVAAGPFSYFPTQ
jgi:hypothetical protein